MLAGQVDPSVLLFLPIVGLLVLVFGGLGALRRRGPFLERTDEEAEEYRRGMEERAQNAEAGRLRIDAYMTSRDESKIDTEITLDPGRASNSDDQKS